MGEKARGKFGVMKEGTKSVNLWETLITLEKINLFQNYPMNPNEEYNNPQL